MKNWIITIALALLLPSMAFAQGDISGRVTDSETGEGLPGTSVVILGTTTGTATDGNGYYTISDVEAGEHNVQATFIGYTSLTIGVTVVNGETASTNYALVAEVYTTQGLSIVADRAKVRETPVAFMDVSKVELEQTVASRDIPLALNTVPGVYATAQGGGAGDARINIRGFDQGNVAVMINGVPVNDMENGWVYWSNWDGLSDVTSSIQVQRGLGSSNLPISSVGGTMNILTDAATLEAGANIKQEIGSGAFFKTTISASTGLINDKFALTVMGVRKVGDGLAEQTWTDAYGYFAALSYQINDKNRIQAFLAGAPQRHGQRSYKQRLGTYDLDYTYEIGADTTGYYESDVPVGLGQLYSPNFGNISYANADDLKEYYNGEVHDARSTSILMERENYYHKPQANINWYYQPTDRVFISSVLYASTGVGGGSGPYGNRAGLDEFGHIDYDDIYLINTDADSVDQAAIDANLANADETRSSSIIRNSVNSHTWFGYIGSVELDVTDNVKTTVGVDLRSYKGEHYREVRNLIGGDYYIDNRDNNQANNVKRLGDKINYHNDGLVRWYAGYGQVEGKFGSITATASGAISSTGYKRVDYFLARENAGDGPMETDWESFIGFRAATGVNYNVTETVNVYGNFGMTSQAPKFGSVFNFNNTLKDQLQNENITAMELGAGYNTRTLKANINVYNTIWTDRYSTGRTTVNNQRYNYEMNGVGAIHRGIEVDAEYTPSRIFKFKAAASLGNWEWNGTPEAIILDDDQNEIERVTAYIDGLKVGDAAQTTFALAATVKPVEGFYTNITFKHFNNYYAQFDPAGRKDPNNNPQAWKVPAYSLIDLHIGYDLPIELPAGAKLDAKVNVFNLLDATYVTDAQDGRNSDASSSSLYLGLPRRFNASIRLTF